MALGATASGGTSGASSAAGGTPTVSHTPFASHRRSRPSITLLSPLRRTTATVIASAPLMRLSSTTWRRQAPSVLTATRCASKPAELPGALRGLDLLRQKQHAAAALRVALCRRRDTRRWPLFRRILGRHAGAGYTGCSSDSPSDDARMHSPWSQTSRTCPPRAIRRSRVPERLHQPPVGRVRPAEPATREALRHRRRRVATHAPRCTFVMGMGAQLPADPHVGCGRQRRRESHPDALRGRTYPSGSRRRDDEPSRMSSKHDDSIHP